MKQKKILKKKNIININSLPHYYKLLILYLIKYLSKFYSFILIFIKIRKNKKIYLLMGCNP